MLPATDISNLTHSGIDKTVNEFKTLIEHVYIDTYIHVYLPVCFYVRTLV